MMMTMQQQAALDMAAYQSHWGKQASEYKRPGAKPVGRPLSQESKQRREVVLSMAKRGMQQSEIARKIGVKIRTIDHDFRAFRRQGLLPKAKANR